MRAKSDKCVLHAKALQQSINRGSKLSHTALLLAYLLVLGLINFSCTLEKRHYRKGYFVQNRHSNTPQNAIQNHKHAPRQQNQFLTPELGPDPAFLIEPSLLANTNPVLESGLPSSQIKYVSGCDSIFLNDGKSIAAKIKEIGTLEIRYKRCDFEEGPDYLIEKSKVDFIFYANGRNEKILHEPASKNPERYIARSEPRRGNETNTLAGLSLSFAILGFYPLIFIGSIVGIMLGLVARKQIRSEPNRFSNEKMADVGLGLSIAGVIFWFLLFFVFVLLM
ncbi:MAG TPA: DUF4190 domain-containing protein [Bacteroidia bacterium]|nr:DUF4190 domain-containing protein [Bacteroidia bacterium]